jgi:hypothetical protein
VVSRIWVVALGVVARPFLRRLSVPADLLGILAGTIPVVIATNSDPGKPLFAIVQTAFSAATSPR